jgi:hypothetical protein
MFASPLHLESHDGGPQNYQFISEDDRASGRLARSILLNSVPFPAGTPDAKIYLVPDRDFVILSIYPANYDAFSEWGYVGQAYRPVGNFVTGEVEGKETSILIPIEIKTAGGIVLELANFGDGYLLDNHLLKNGKSSLETSTTNRPSMYVMDVVVASNGVSLSDLRNESDPYPQPSASGWAGGVQIGQYWYLDRDLVPPEYWAMKQAFFEALDPSHTEAEWMEAAQKISVEVSPASLAGLSRTLVRAIIVRHADDPTLNH